MIDGKEPTMPICRPYSFSYNRPIRDLKEHIEVFPAFEKEVLPKHEKIKKLAIYIADLDYNLREMKEARDKLDPETDPDDCAAYDEDIKDMTERLGKLQLKKKKKLEQIPKYATDYKLLEEVPTIEKNVGSKRYLIASHFEQWYQQVVKEGKSYETFYQTVDDTTADPNYEQDDTTADPNEEQGGSFETALDLQSPSDEDAETEE